MDGGVAQVIPVGPALSWQRSVAVGLCSILGLCRPCGFFVSYM